MSFETKVNPSYYKNGKVECIDAIESATINKSGVTAYCTGNIIKYVWRCEEKGGLEDMKKAMWYLQRMIAHEESKIAIENFEKREPDNSIPSWSKL